MHPRFSMVSICCSCKVWKDEYGEWTRHKGTIADHWNILLRECYLGSCKSQNSHWNAGAFPSEDSPIYSYLWCIMDTPWIWIFYICLTRNLIKSLRQKASINFHLMLKEYNYRWENVFIFEFLCFILIGLELRKPGI